MKFPIGSHPITPAHVWSQLAREGTGRPPRSVATPATRSRTRRYSANRVRPTGDVSPRICELLARLMRTAPCRRRSDHPQTLSPWHALATLLLACTLPCTALTASEDHIVRPQRDNPLITPNPSGTLKTWTPAGRLDESNPFFQVLGSNGRSCNSCHVQEAAWGTSVTRIRARFEASNGTDPIFRPIDGANSPRANVATTAARRRAYNMLLTYGTIRIGMPMPEDAEFTLVYVIDPWGYASAAELSLFRRPLPATNLRFLTSVMWDGRETILPFVPPMGPGAAHADLVASLRQQAVTATLGHAQAEQPPTLQQLKAIVAFELSISTAQVSDRQAGRLDIGVAIGGPRVLASQRFYVGINDPFGLNPTGAPFDADAAMSLFDGFTRQRGHARRWRRGRRQRARAAIERGQDLFNTLPITITGVAGLNDALGVASFSGHCSTCHNTPNVGNHSSGAPLDIGVADASRRQPGFPLYFLMNKTTRDIRVVTDPGLAMITGQWDDIGKFKGPILRGLAARAPYFHNGSAATLGEVVAFYDERFDIGITPQQTADLVAFLSAL